MKIGIIGYGNMGRALYKLLSAKFDIYVCDRDEEQMKEINTEKKSMDANDIINKSDIIILAVKPQMFEKLAK